MIRKLLLALMLFCFSAGVSPVQGAASVTEEVKNTVDGVLKVVTNKELKKPQNEDKRRKELKAVIGRVFDYEEMAKRSLGAHWKTLTPAKQKEFVGLFATLLENSYAGKIESYNNEKILYGNEQVEGNRAEVSSRVITAKRDEYTLDYRLLRKGEAWMVYDVIIEGVSLVSNYRSQFNKIIVERGYGELEKKLKSKSEEISAP